MDANRALEESMKLLIAEFTPDKIILFGSHAWGNPGPSSDLDILVIVESSSDRPIDRAIRAHRKLKDIPFPKDVLVRTKEEMERKAKVFSSLEATILEKGKVVYVAA